MNMNGQEREELRELRDRLIRQETLLEQDFKFIKDEFREISISIRTLNEEYGKLIEREHELELKYTREEHIFKQNVMYWKLAACIASPVATALLIAVLSVVFGL